MYDHWNCEGDEKGIYGPQLRFDRQLFVFKV